MKAANVVTQLAVLLPQLSDKYTSNVAVQSVTRSGTVLTVQCKDEHGLDVGNAVALQGATTRITGALTRSGTTGTFVADSDIDPNSTDLFPNSTFSGSVEAEFNGTFVVIAYDNRRTIRFTMVDSGPTTATGTPAMENGESQLRVYDKTYVVASTPSPSVFTVVEPNTTMLDPTGTITARGRPRIATGVSPQRMLEAFTEKNDKELWLFVVLGEVASSKSRNIRSDAVDNIGPGDFFRQQVIEPVTLYLFIPAQKDLGAGAARDLAQDEFLPLCQSILAFAFDTGLTFSGGRLQFLTHGTFDYNTAYYVHAYSFQQVISLYEDDTVGPDLDVAFRDITFSMDPDIPGSTNTTALTAALDLDGVPL